MSSTSQTNARINKMKYEDIEAELNRLSGEAREQFVDDLHYGNHRWSKYVTQADDVEIEYADQDERTRPLATPD